MSGPLCAEYPNNIAPNDTYVIDKTIEYILKDNDRILSIVSLNKIDEVASIIYALEKILNDENLFKTIYDHFDFSDTFANNVRIKYCEKIEELIRSIIIKYVIQSYKKDILSVFAEILRDNNSTFVFQFVDIYIKETKNRFVLMDKLIVLISTDNIGAVITLFNSYNDENVNLMAARFFWWYQNEYQEIFDLSKERYNDYYIPFDEMRNNSIKEHESTPEEYNLIKQFEQYLNIGDGKFATNVFTFYTSNKIRLKPFITDKHIERLKELIIKSILRYDLSGTEVTKEIVTDGSYNIWHSRGVKIFETAIPLFIELDIPPAEYRVPLIKFIPYSINNVDNKHIYTLLGDLSPLEIDIIVQFYKQERSDDLYDVNFNNFLSFCSQYKPKEIFPIIKNYILTKRLKPYYRKLLADLLLEIDNSNSTLKQIFDTYYESKVQEEISIALVANNYLIKANDISAIEWRLKYVLHLIRKDDSSLNINYLTNIRGNQLLAVSNPSHFNTFLSSLIESIELVKSGDLHTQIALNYWQIIFSYFVNLAQDSSLHYFRKIERIISDYSKNSFYPLLKENLNKVKISFLTKTQKPNTFPACINVYNNLKERAYLPISSSEGLSSIIENILENDIKRWIEGEGAYKVIELTKGKQESLIQKTILTQFEVCLLRRGLRNNDIRIKREEQSLDDTRPDFTISYGFIGQIFIEIKRANNKDISAKDVGNYKMKLNKYLVGSKSDYGFLLIINTHLMPHTFTRRISMVKDVFENSLITVVGIDGIVQ